MVSQLRHFFSVSWGSTTRKNLAFFAICLSVYKSMDCGLFIHWVLICYHHYWFWYSDCPRFVQREPLQAVSFWQNPLSTCSQGSWAESDKCKGCFKKSHWLTLVWRINGAVSGGPAGSGEGIDYGECSFWLFCSRGFAVTVVFLYFKNFWKIFISK